MRTTIPVIDIFAGPGGLGEGFSHYRPDNRENRAFRILLSVEKEALAHKTLELRSFFRQFVRGVPDDYYRYLRGEITRESLFKSYPNQASCARREAMLAELGPDDKKIYARISKRLKTLPNRNWLLVGGPPCQAYSIIGRSRSKGDTKDIKIDERQVLYQEYLKILAKFQPAAFIMENVKGILSSEATLDTNAKPDKEGKQELIFRRIFNDIKRPMRAVLETEPDWNTDQVNEEVQYRIYSVVVERDDLEKMQPTDFIVRCEDYGIPQARHRVIMLGVRSDLAIRPKILATGESKVGIEDVIGGLPALRSQISRGKGQVKDSPDAWRHSIREVQNAQWFTNIAETVPLRQPTLFDDDCEPNDCLKQSILAALEGLRSEAGIGSEFLQGENGPVHRPDWFLDQRIGGVCNHMGRSHMISDLHRYLYLSCYGQVHGLSPSMLQMPRDLWPKHKNVDTRDPKSGSQPFGDRFRVQVKGKPATTVTSHISKDGHYNVHYDPTQCRSLTVREAARIQTFPDNYFFEGPRTEQYHQVGNAVPPLLANKIAGIVYNLFERIDETGRE